MKLHDKNTAVGKARCGAANGGSETEVTAGCQQVARQRKVARMIPKFAFISNVFAMIAQTWEGLQFEKTLLFLGARSLRAGVWMSCFCLWFAAASLPAMSEEVTLLNVSYDPTRELWRDINNHFIPVYEKKAGNTLSIKQSHGGSSTQARAVIDGLDADVVTLASFLDTAAISKKGLIKQGWVDRLPHRSLPYYSTIVFVVRKGNPKAIKDWPDLVKPGVEIITPNPKTSGNGYLSFFSAWGSVVQRGGSRQDAIDYVTRLYKQVPVLDSGARGATTTFVQKQIGDVHLAWENEAHLEVVESKGELDLIYPPLSIRAEPHVALVDENVDRKKTRNAAEAYLKYLYTDEAQEIIAKNFYRPSNDAVLQKYASVFPDIKLFPITAIAKDFPDAHKQYIGDGGVFDTIYKPKGH